MTATKKVVLRDTCISAVVKSYPKAFDADNKEIKYSSVMEAKKLGFSIDVFTITKEILYVISTDNHSITTSEDELTKLRDIFVKLRDKVLITAEDINGIKNTKLITFEPVYVLTKSHTFTDEDGNSFTLTPDVVTPAIKNLLPTGILTMTYTPKTMLVRKGTFITSTNQLNVYGEIISIDRFIGFIDSIFTAVRGLVDSDETVEDDLEF